MNTGLDGLLANPAVLGAPRVGLVTNDAVLTSSFEPARTALLRAGTPVTRLFSPEHGLSAQGHDGAAQVDGIDRLTGLPVSSLYGAHFAPNADDLAEIDVVLFDLPDVGCRFYTYLWTLTHVMEACARHGTPLVVLDRPNPLGGDLALVEGPMLDEATCSSFIGRWSIPLRHSLTLGELARHWVRSRSIDLDLTVIPVTGWSRSSLAHDPWVPTSPAMPSATTAALYPGMGLLEAINVSDGRGTALPFRVVGAPWIDGVALSSAFGDSGLPGIAAVPYSFTPAAEKHAGALCSGVLFIITDRETLRPVRTGVALLHLIGTLWPEHIDEHRYITAANPSGHGHLDKLLGIAGAYDRVLSGDPQLSPSLECPDWAADIADALLY